MVKFKKILFLLGLVAFSLVLVACRKDTEAPTITVENTTITHVVNETVDFLKDITVEDNITEASKIKLEVTDWGNYDKAKAGTYVITITATDEAGNSSEVKITVKVEEPEDVDDTPPMINASSNTPINHLAGEEYDLTKGLTGVDNKDGVNVGFKVVDLGSYNKDVAGTYVVKIVAYDSAGNESQPVERTVIVSESYARAEMTSIEGEIVRYKALYNPQVLNGHTGTGYNTAYDGHYVNVLSKEYVEWLLEYAPERLGSGVGWSVIAVTNEDNEIVYVRHWNSGEAFIDENGEFVSQRSRDWSTGTVYTWTEEVNGVLVGKDNGRWAAGEMGMMMANINKWIPEGGHVFMFMNWTTIKLDENGQVALKANESDMPRSMGANHIMNSDVDGDEVLDYAIGRKLYILDPELSDQVVRKSFDPENPFPIITIPGVRYVNESGVWKIDYIDRVYLPELSEENPYNPLRGITANDGKGNDITDQITYKVYRYTTTQLKYNLYPSIPVTDPLWAEYFDDVFKLSENEVTLEAALQPQNDQVYFVVEFTVEANGHEEKAYRIIQVQKQFPDYLELFDEGDTVFSDVFRLEQRLDLNPDLDEFGNFANTEKGIIYDASTFKNVTNFPVMERGVVVVLDNKYNVQFVRIAHGATFEFDREKVTTEVTWDDDIMTGLKDLVPSDGYVIIYPEGKNQAVLTRALRAFYDFDYAGGVIEDVNVVNGISRINLKIKEVSEVSTLKVNGETPQIDVNGELVNIFVIENSKESLIFNSGRGGAGFRLDSGKAYYYTKDMYKTLSESTEVVSSFTSLSPNHGVPWFNNGVLVILDADGNFYQARLAVGVPAQINADGTVIFGNAAARVTTEAALAEQEEDSNLTWDIITPNAANTKAHGPLADILDVLPDGGSFYIFPNATDSKVRDAAIKLFWNPNYTGGAIVDNDNEAAATNGFDAETFDAEYFETLSVISDFVATETDKAPKLPRPVVTINENVITWAKIEGAEKYTLYVDGAVKQDSIGTLNEETGVYSFDLGTLGLESGTYTVQLRAFAADSKVNSTSVLSDAVEYKSERLSMPANFILEEDVVKWDAVTGAVKYLVRVDDAEPVEVETPEFQVPEDKLVNGTVIGVIAVGTGGILDSQEAEFVLQIEPEKVFAIMIGDKTANYKEFTLAEWLHHADPNGGNDVGAKFVPGLVVVTDLADLADLDDSTKLINGGYLALVGSDMKVKYIATRWGQSWDTTDGWKLNGANQTEQWAWGLNLLASYVKPHLAEGDFLVLASQYGDGLPSGTYRDFLGNLLIKELPSGDHRNVTTFDDAIDPSTVEISFVEVVTKEAIKIGSTVTNYRAFTLEEWLEYADPDGSNDIGAQWIQGFVVVTDLDDLADMEDDTKIFAGGYLAVVDSENKVKYIATRWGQSWDTTDGWKLNGANQTEQWNWGATLFASYVKPHLAEGDYLILASQYGGGLPSGTYRNLFGNELIKVLESDHRSVTTFDDVIDPSTVEIFIGEVVEYLPLD